VKSNQLIGEGAADRNRAPSPTHGAVALNAPQFPTIGVRWIGRAWIERSRGWDVEAARRLLPQRGVGTQRVVAFAKRSKARCWRSRFTSGGLTVSSRSVRCMRSWRPFCSGWPGSIRSGRMPSLTHQPPVSRGLQHLARRTAGRCQNESPSAGRARERRLRRSDERARCRCLRATRIE
jgi:hypothetical protein